MSYRTPPSIYLLSLLLGLGSSGFGGLLLGLNRYFFYSTATVTLLYRNLTIPLIVFLSYRSVFLQIILQQSSVRTTIYIISTVLDRNLPTIVPLTTIVSFLYRTFSFAACSSSAFLTAAAASASAYKLLYLLLNSKIKERYLLLGDAFFLSLLSGLLLGLK